MKSQNGKQYDFCGIIETKNVGVLLNIFSVLKIKTIAKEPTTQLLDTY